MKNIKNYFSLLSLLFFSILLNAQNKTGVTLFTDGGTASLRGMSIPNENVIWVSGSKGTVGKSTNGGKNWSWLVVPKYEQSDFRDIEAFDSLTAIIMAIGNPGIILKTKDGGITWKKVFYKEMKEMFLDAMDFKDNKTGICIGDPFYIGSSGKKYFYMLRTEDGGDTWEELPAYKLAPVQQPDGEAIFAASGTSIQFLKHPEFEFAFVTGGKMSNIYFMAREGKQSKVLNIPINQGVESTGAFSFATDGFKKFYCIGGDYKEPHNQYDNYYFTVDEGKKWGTPNISPPFGYRSCIKIVKDKTMVACGTGGVDFTKDGGKEWINGSTIGFNVCMVSPITKTVYLAGDKGRVGKLIY